MIPIDSRHHAQFDQVWIEVCRASKKNGGCLQQKLATNGLNPQLSDET